ncbi:MAG: transporter [Paenibacillaceae bacterium]|jgi:MFS family permease|nr:transporter [Paenibacillaceae bacterium]
MENKTKIWTKDFLAILIINLMIFFGFQMLIPTLPIYVKSLGGADSIIGWITGLTTISAIMIRPVSGIAVDKLGRKGILLTGVGVIIAMTLAYWWFPYVGIILAIRFLHGFGWGAAGTASNTVATDVIPKERFGEAMGFFSLSSGLAMALAPGLGLTLYAGLKAPGLMLVSAGFGAIAFILSFFLRYRAVEPQQKTIKKMAMFERSSMRPAVIMFFVSAAYGSVVSFLSLYALEKGISNIGVFFLIYAGAMLVTRPLFGRLVDRFGFNIPMYLGLVLLIIAMATLSQASTMLIFLIVALLYGIGFGAVQSSLQTLAVIYAPKDRLGTANATFFTGFDGGIGFGAILAGIVASSMGYGSMYLLFAFLPILAGIIYFFTSGKAKQG